MPWWRRLLAGRRLEQQLDAELRDHFDRLVSEHRAAGLPLAEARRRARLAFGGIEQAKEACRDVRGTRWLDDTLHDVRYAVRLLRRSPGFTAVAVLSLALGIGANSAIFALVDGVLLKTLPVADPEGLVLLQDGSWTNPIWEQIRDRQQDLGAGALAWSNTRFDLSRGGATQFVEGTWASGGFFDVLGVPALLGRTFTAADDRRGGGPDGPVAVISYAFWQRHFAGDAAVIGRTLPLNRIPFTVIGVTPPSFLGPTPGRSYDVAVPIGTAAVVLGERHWLDSRLTWVLEVMVRLRPGQTVEQATEALRRVQPQVREATIPHEPGARQQFLEEPFSFEPAAAGPGGLRAAYRQPLLIIMGVVVLVLLIACANLANLLLARAAGRRHELTVRAALGASRWRIARQLLVEALLLSSLGAAAGLFFAQWASRLLVAQLSTPRSRIVLDLTLDWRVVAFTAATTVATALLFGVAPAWRVRRVDPHDALKEQGRTMSGSRSGITGAPMLAAQVALTMVLVVAAGLFLRTFARLATVDIGLDRERVLVVDVDAARARAEARDRLALFERARAAAAAVPGVSSAALSLLTPVSGSGWNGEILSASPSLQGRQRMAFYNSVTPGWFATMGTSLKAGRDFSTADVHGAPLVGIVNETFGRRLLQPGNPVGQRARFSTGPTGDREVTVVGVVADAAYRSVRDPVPPVLYFPVAQAHHDDDPPALSLSIRAAAGPPAALTRSVADAIGAVDRDLALTFRPLSAFIDGTLVRERLLALVSLFFGALALLLSAIGLYGVTAYAVNRRRREIGIRMALGARSAAVVGLILRRVALWVAVGVAAGVMISLWASRYVASLLYGFEPRDPATLAGAALFLGLVASLAAWLPARRAAAVDPAGVLRDA